MKSFTVLSSLALAFAPFVAAHGIVDALIVDGKRYQGPNTGRGSKNSVIRQVTSINPTYGATNPAVNCGPGAQPAALSATAKPGSNLLFNWVTQPGQKWPHNLGPELTYMASCGKDDCSKFDHRNAKWFKIGQDGLVNGKWAQTRDAFAGKPSPARIPDNLAPGNYLVMHQLISLHLADKFKGAEFYSSCAQLKVTGSGTGVPSAKDLVTFPGAYNDRDKGIFINVFDSVRNYPFPGPPIAQLGSRSSSEPEPEPVNNNGSEEPTPENNNGGEEPTPENNNGGDKPSEQPPKPENNYGDKPSVRENDKPTPENSEGASCKKTKRSKKAKRSSEYKPRQVSRVMRDIVENLEDLSS